MQVRGALTFLLGLAVTVSVGCAPTSPRLSFAVEQRLLRETTLDDLPEGRAEAGDAVVRVVRQHGACSGAVIGPRHVLTARHCVVKVDLAGELTAVRLAPGDVHVALGGDYLPWGRVGVRRIHSCDDGAGVDVRRDVAVLILSQPLPSEVPRLGVAYDLAHDVALVMPVFESSGFGSNGPLQRIPLTTWTVSSVERHGHRGPMLVFDEDQIFVGLAVAPGDSGGPILDSRTGSVVSVVSRGTVNHDSLHERPDPPSGAKVATSGPRLSACRSVIERALEDQLGT